MRWTSGDLTSEKMFLIIECAGQKSCTAPLDVMNAKSALCQTNLLSRSRYGASTHGGFSAQVDDPADVRAGGVVDVGRAA